MFGLYKAIYIMTHLSIESLETLSLIDWRKLPSRGKTLLLQKFGKILASGKRDDEILEVVSRIFKCGKKAARDYLSVLGVIKVSNSKLKRYVGK